MNFVISNRLLYVLHKSEKISELGEKKKNKIINQIMKDIEKIGLFDLPQENPDNKFDDLEYKSDIFFGKEEQSRVTKRIKQKRIELGLYDENEENDENNNKSYGRTPLHDAIALKDIVLVKKYLKQGKYLIEKDNNGNTAYKMAFYERYDEAIKLFKKLRRS